MIELMVGLTILAFLLVSGVPSFSDWIRNAKIRGEAESILSGLQHARMEAVRRNTAVTFQLTSTLDNSCALSTAGQNWVVNIPTSTGVTPAGSCGTAISDTTSPYILQTSPSTSNSTSITVSASPQATVTFNGFGQQTSATAPGMVTIDVTSPQGTCLAAGGTVRCLRIQVSPAGLPRMCDLSATGSTGSQPMSCT